MLIYLQRGTHMRNRLAHGATGMALMAVGLIGVAFALPGHMQRPASARYAAPPMSSVGSGYPINADNGTDIYEDSGPVTIVTTPLIGTTSGSPVQQIAAVAGKKIRVLGFNLTSSAAGSVQFQDEAGGPNKLSGVYTLAANGSLVINPNKMGCIDTASGAALDIAVTGSSNTVGGTITYCYH